MLAAGPGEVTGKPRPFVVVQSDAFNDPHASFSLCPITSITSGDHLFRVPLPSTATTGLNLDSEVQVDKVQTLRRERLVRVIGAASANSMTMVDDALRRWLQL